MCCACLAEKDISNFRFHKSRKTYVSRCIPCIKIYMKDWRKNNPDKVKSHYISRYYKDIEHSRELSRKSYNKPESKKKKREYAKRNKKTINKNVRKWHDNNPLKVKAHWMIHNRLRSGKIKRLPCTVCENTKSEAHHKDYSKPLDVMWLCRAHHREWHRLNKEEYERINNGNN